MNSAINLPSSLNITRTVDPTSDAVTLAEAKTHLLVNFAEDDTIIGSILKSAIREAEEITGKQLVTATYVTKLNNFPCEQIVLYRPPLQSVTSITYVDAAGTTQTLSTSVYDVDTSVQPGIIRLKYGQTWPTCRGWYNDVVITFKAGYGASGCTDVQSIAAIPETIKSGIKLLTQAQYDPIRSGNGDESEVMRNAAINLLMMERCQGL